MIMATNAAVKRNLASLFSILVLCDEGKQEHGLGGLNGFTQIILLKKMLRECVGQGYL
jgi:hypothetical protein